MGSIRFAAAGFGALAAVLVVAGPVAADPKMPDGQTTTIDCGAGPVPMALAGNGQWTPAHALDSTSVYQPVAFGAGTSEFLVLTGDHAGETGTGPAQEPATKSGTRVGQGSLACTYRIEGTFYEPNFDGLLQFTSTGVVYVRAKA